MQRKHNDLDAGRQAFVDALKPQEGQFQRAATYIMNDPKNMADKPARRESTPTPNQNLAERLLHMAPDGTFKPRGG